MNEKIIFMIKPLDDDAWVNPEACQHPLDKIKPAYFQIGETDSGIRVMEPHRICTECFLIDPICHVQTVAPISAE